MRFDPAALKFMKVEELELAPDAAQVGLEVRLFCSFSFLHIPLGPFEVLSYVLTFELELAPDAAQVGLEVRESERERERSSGGGYPSPDLFASTFFFYLPSTL
jgi:hypothetical protein